MGVVLKKGGKRKEAFSAAKIIRSVEKAAKDAKISSAKLVKEIAKPTIEYFKKKKIVKSTDIRRSILGKLERKSKAAAKAWRSQEKKKKK